MSDSYCVITTSEDGDIGVSQQNTDSLLTSLNDLDNPDFASGCMSKEDLANHPDPMYWGGASVIIKGHVVVPKSKKVVEEYGIE